MRTSWLGDYLALVRFSHSIFALPFAWISLLLATAGRPGFGLVALVAAAAVSARTAAMAFNRWADRSIDAANPRTRGREIPSGRIAPWKALALAVLAGGLFCLISALLGPTCLLLSPVVLLVLFGYSYTKRWSWLCHFVLGLALALAPLGAWIAAKDGFDGILGTPLLLGLAVLTWVAGFDLIYACQDEEFDRGLGLHSVPARFGRAGALKLSASLHGATLLFLAGVGWTADLGGFWWGGIVLAAGLLIHEHRLVSPSDLSRVDAAFFSMNGLFSLLLALLASLDFWF